MENSLIYTGKSQNRESGLKCIEKGLNQRKVSSIQIGLKYTNRSQLYR